MPDAPNLPTLLRYWRDTVAFAQMADVSPHSSTGWDIDKESLRAGCFSQQKTQTIFEQSAKEQKKQKARDIRKGNDEPLALPVVITALSVRRLKKDGAGNGWQETVALLCIPALLSADGHLSPQEDTLPWIPRKHLAPTPQLAVGPLDDYDRFITQHPALTSQDWDGLWSYACDLFSSVSGHNIGSFKIDGYECLMPWVQLIDTNSQGATKAILDGYSDLLDSASSLPRLLKHLLSGDNPQVAESQSWKKSLAHVGQMRNDFGLAESQRQSLACAMRLGDGELLAVNGPPGTGKTTLLQSIIATLWVQSLLSVSDALEAVPPVILGCSTNNQAVTNILDSFDTSGSPSDPLFRRWLPAPVNTYGLAFPSQTTLGKEEFTSTYAYATKVGKYWNGLPQQVENPEFVRAAEIHYLNEARHYFQQAPGSVEDVVRALHSNLKDTQKKLSNLILSVQQTEAAISAAKFSGFPQTVDAARQQEELLLLAEQQELQALTVALTDAKSRLSRKQALQARTYSAYRPQGMKERLFFWSSSLRADRLQRAILEYRKNPTPIKWPELKAILKAGVQTQQSAVIQAQNQLDQAKSRHHDAIKHREAALSALTRWQSLFAELSTSPQFSQSYDILDQSLRYQMFHLAGRYWEGRWLLQMRELLTNGKNRESQAQKDVEQRFRRWAMLSPCFVSTLHNSPKVFDYFDGQRRPLYNFFDMIVVDEAGQISPELCPPTLALGKKAVIVGDIYQIEPVWSVTPGLDFANMHSYGLEPSKLQQKNLTCSSSSVMKLAAGATAWTQSENASEPGMFLSEHRRCKDPIIAFCNELVYQGQLKALAGSHGNGITPMMGYCHITHSSTIRGGSRSNEGEAQTIAHWLQTMRPDLEKKYQKKIGEIVGIISPYRAQALAIGQALSEAGLDATSDNRISVGTVHTFQGAERPIVIFSPAVSYNTNESRRLFFDIGPNMLNVAVSRAKDSFLVFGDMRIFNPEESTPSACLARHLFMDESNEIINDYALRPLEIKSDPVIRRINTLDGHRQVLQKAINEAQQKLLIVSPFLSILALKEDSLCDILQSAVNRGVKIVVITDPSLNRERDRQRVKLSYFDAVHQLRECGCVVIEANRIHNKTIAVDASWIVEGSFNWLSAVRNPDHAFSRREISIAYHGGDVADHIESEWQAYADLISS